MRKAMGSKRAIGTGELAEFLSVKRVTIERWCRAGKLPAFRNGSARLANWRVMRRDFHDWLLSPMGARYLPAVATREPEPVRHKHGREVCITCGRALPLRECPPVKTPGHGDAGG